MEGDALEWFQWIDENKSLSTWSAFKVTLDIHFSPFTFEDYQGKLAKLM